MYPRRSFTSCIIVPVGVMMLLCGVFGIVWLRSNLIAMEYGISELEKSRMDRLRETKMLMAEKAALLASQKVEKTAAGSLGLVVPDRRRVVYVKTRTAVPYRASFELPGLERPEDRGAAAVNAAGRGAL